MSDEQLELRKVPFGTALRYYRKRGGLSQTDLGRAAGVNQTTLSDWEARIEPPADVFTLSRIAEVLRVDLDDLREGVIRPEVSPAVEVKPRPGQESLQDLVRRYFPDDEQAEVMREIQKFLTLDLEGMRALNRVSDAVLDLLDLQSGEGSEGEGEERKRRHKRTLPPTEEFHGRRRPRLSPAALNTHLEAQRREPGA